MAADAAPGATEDSAPPRLNEAGHRPDVDALCEYFADSAVNVAGAKKREDVKPEHRAAMRLLLDDKDYGLDPDKMRRVIDWVHRHEFWQSVVETPLSLRKNFTKIDRQARRTSAPTGAAAAKQAAQDDIRAAAERRAAARAHATATPLAITAGSPTRQEIAQ